MEKKEFIFDLLDTESAMEAIDFVGDLANKNQIDWAICGGIAMAMYGNLPQEKTLIL